MWHELIGTWGYAAGSSGTVTVPAGAVVTQIVVHSTAGGHFTIFGGASVPVVAAAPPSTYQFNHSLVQSNTGNTSVIFTSTDSYYVEYVKAGNT